LANVVTEHVLLMLPVFFAMMVFGLAATNIVLNYGNQQSKIIITGAERQLTGAIQQLYYIMVQDQVKDCTVTLSNPLPVLIDGQNYKVTASEDVTGTLTLSFVFSGTSTTYTTTFPMGPVSTYNWKPGELNSSVSTAVIKVVKVGGFLTFSFG